MFALNFAANMLSQNYTATGNSWDNAIRAYNGGAYGYDIGSANQKTLGYLQSVLGNAAKAPRPSSGHNVNRKNKKNGVRIHAVPMR